MWRYTVIFNPFILSCSFAFRFAFCINVQDFVFSGFHMKCTVWIADKMNPIKFDLHFKWVALFIQANSVECRFNWGMAGIYSYLRQIIEDERWSDGVKYHSNNDIETSQFNQIAENHFINNSTQKWNVTLELVCIENIYLMFIQFTIISLFIALHYSRNAGNRKESYRISGKHMCNLLHLGGSWPNLSGNHFIYHFLHFCCLLVSLTCLLLVSNWGQIGNAESTRNAVVRRILMFRNWWLDLLVYLYGCAAIFSSYASVAMYRRRRMPKI